MICRPGPGPVKEETVEPRLPMTFYAVFTTLERFSGQEVETDRHTGPGRDARTDLAAEDVPLRSKIIRILSGDGLVRGYNIFVRSRSDERKSVRCRPQLFLFPVVEL